MTRHRRDDRIELTGDEATGNRPNIRQPRDNYDVDEDDGEDDEDQEGTDDDGQSEDESPNQRGRLPLSDDTAFQDVEIESTARKSVTCLLACWLIASLNCQSAKVCF